MWLLVLLITCSAVHGVERVTTCKRSFVKLGCHAIKKRYEPVLLVNDRETGVEGNDGLHIIDWDDFETSLRSLACRCHDKAEEMNLLYFGMTFFGECWGYRGDTEIVKMMKEKHSVSSHCVNINYQPCVHGAVTECIGTDKAVYVYGRIIETGVEKAVDGGFGDWGSWTECSQQCGEGFQERERLCNNPTPVNGGKDCSSAGNYSESKSCQLKECPIDGGLSDWSDFGSCSKECGGGTMTRTRECSNPAPAHGGQPCADVMIDETVCNVEPCSVDGGLSDWSSYSQCSATCGGGTQDRVRECNNPTPANGGEDCTGVLRDEKDCNTNECPVDGGLSDWSHYSACSVTCGGGTQKRTRACNNPEPSHGGKRCEEALEESKICGSDKCPVDGGVSEWSEYSSCTATCGGGVRSRARQCTNPAPANGGEDCSENLEETEDCATDECPVAGGLSDWSPFSECSSSCGGGKMKRNRKCSNPVPANGGADCSGPFEETSSCSSDPCPVDGGFTKWSKYSKCSKTCDGGVRIKRRKCTNPTPLNGGKDCDGPLTYYLACNTNKCPAQRVSVIEKYACEFNHLKLSCPKGTIHIVSALYGRLERGRCESNSIHTTDCKADNTANIVKESCQHETSCELHASSGIFGDPCMFTTKYLSVKYICEEERKPAKESHACEHKHLSISCESGTINIVSAVYGRLDAERCPTPFIFTTNCRAKDSMSIVAKKCQNKQRCDVHASSSVFGDPCIFQYKYLVVKYDCEGHKHSLTEWSEYSQCTASCGGGRRTRARQCFLPEHSSEKCPDTLQETERCNEDPCPIDGGFSKWSQFSSCSKRCGGGVETRVRLCINPSPQHGGDDCMGDKTETRQCNTQHCPVDGGLSQWARVSSCTKRCGGGVETRRRSCTDPQPQHGGRGCVGITTLTQRCNPQPCPVNGRFTNWSGYSPCTKPCGVGMQSRTRTCTNPAPQHGGRNCYGFRTSVRRCNTHSCPVDGGFSQWSTFSRCSRKCGGGVEYRRRTCTNPTPCSGGKKCVGMTTHTQRCNPQPCPVNGRFTRWSKYSRCSKTCGGGTQIKRRSCTAPAPRHGGAACKGPNTYSRRCNRKACPVFRTRFMEKFACEHQEMNLSCSRGKLQINWANYGRLRCKMCTKKWHRFWFTNCHHRRKSLQVVNQYCRGKSSCSVRASNSVFGDPCRYVFKYLHVKYRCVEY